MGLEKVIYEVHDHIAKVVMNRPEKRNALDYQLLIDLDAAFAQADDDPDVRVIILSGAGSAFCSGYDLKASPYTVLPEGADRWTPSNALRTMRKISDRYLMIKDMSKPVVAQVHGYCLAAGCYLQMCCDIAIAADDAVLGHPATRQGGVTSMPLWITYLGERKAKEMLMTSKLISGTEAERIGLINRAVPAAELESEVMKTAKSIAEVPPDGMIMLKEAIDVHAQIMHRDALFAYHRQLNALGRLGPLGRGGEGRGEGRGK
jgi:enoyl-CoA hydratase